MSIALTVSALNTVLMFQEHAPSLETAGGLCRFSARATAVAAGMDVMHVFTVALVLLALINAVLVTWFNGPGRPSCDSS